MTRPDPTSWTMKALAAGEIDIGVNYCTNLILELDAGEPVVILGGIHVGCSELFGGELAARFSFGINRVPALRGDAASPRRVAEAFQAILREAPQ